MSYSINNNSSEEEYKKLDVIFEDINLSKNFIEDRKVLSKSLKPKVAMGAPYLRHIIKDKPYFYCTCGYSKNQPFCDGESHEGTGFKPLKFKRDIQTTLVALCGCKHNKVEVRFILKIFIAYEGRSFM